MDDQRVAKIREQLLDASDHIMDARRLVGVLHYESVSLDTLLDHLRVAHGVIDEMWSALHEVAP